jgi:hypothetical protein
VATIYSFGRFQLNDESEIPFRGKEPTTVGQRAVAPANKAVLRAASVIDMLDLARYIVNQKAGRFDPEKFKDQYETAPVDLINQKRAGPSPRKSDRVARTSSI